MPRGSPDGLCAAPAAMIAKKTMVRISVLDRDHDRPRRIRSPICLIRPPGASGCFVPVGDDQKKRASANGRFAGSAQHVVITLKTTVSINDFTPINPQTLRSRTEDELLFIMTAVGGGGSWDEWARTELSRR